MMTTPLDLKAKINGMLLIDKPQGLTSNAVLQQVKRLYGAKKAGHTGSLDPLATGMLPICFGEATKWSQYLLDADKCYEVTGQLGIKTTTGDAMGEVLFSNPSFHVSEKALHEMLSTFKGPIKQLPSMFSALKHQGQPLYKYARKGITIERPPREVVIHDLQLTQFDGQFFSLKVVCSKGTYIRNLVEDIGDKLGVYAHVTALRRLYTAGFENAPMITIQGLEAQSLASRMEWLLPIDQAVSHLPKINLTATEATALSQGKILPSCSAPLQGLVRLYENTQFIGLGILDETNQLKVKRLLDISLLSKEETVSRSEG